MNNTRNSFREDGTMGQEGGGGEERNVKIKLQKKKTSRNSQLMMQLKKGKVKVDLM